MDKKSTIQKLLQGSEVKQSDKASLAKFTVPVIKEASGSGISVGSVLTLVLPGFSSEAYDRVALIVVDDNEQGEGGVVSLNSGKEVTYVVNKNNFTAGDKVKVKSIFHPRTGDLWLSGLTSEAYTFI